jgi:ATP adenylyltransferase
MDQLWAPWRLAYVAKEKPPTPGDECFICRGLAQSNDRENLIVRRTEQSVVLLNRFPYNTGHLLVSPQAHLANLQDLSEVQLLDTMQTLREMLTLLKATMNPEGFNVGINLGKVAGAGLPGHLHWHIVPRWNGDMNFMPVVSDTKVIVQSLDALYDLLTKQLS